MLFVFSKQMTKKAFIFLICFSLNFMCGTLKFELSWSYIYIYNEIFIENVILNRLISFRKQKMSKSMH